MTDWQAGDPVFANASREVRLGGIADAVEAVARDRAQAGLLEAELADTRATPMREAIEVELREVRERLGTSSAMLSGAIERAIEDRLMSPPLRLATFYGDRGALRPIGDAGVSSIEDAAHLHVRERDAELGGNPDVVAKGRIAGRTTFGPDEDDGMEQLSPLGRFAQAIRAGKMSGDPLLDLIAGDRDAAREVLGGARFAQRVVLASSASRGDARTIAGELERIIHYLEALLGE